MSVLPLSAIDWQNAIKAVLLGHAQPMDFYENWFIHSPSITVRVPAVVISRGPFIHIKRQVAHRYNNAFLRDDFTCQYCGKKTLSPTGDHVLPKSKGGSNRLTNISTSCGACNNRKGDNANIRPSRLPHMPSYYELVKKHRDRPISVPHASWGKYIGWDVRLIKLVEPVGMPGYLPIEPEYIDSL